MEDDGRLGPYYASLPPSELHIFNRTGGAIGAVVLGPWAQKIAVDHLKSASTVKPFGTSAIPSVFVNGSAVTEIIRDTLLVAGVAVRLHEREVNGGWRCIKKGSPGNLGDFECLLFDLAGDAVVSTASLLALHVLATRESSVFVYGCATVNATLRRIGYCQFSDAATAHALDAILTQYSIKEVLYVDTLGSTMPALMTSLQRICDRISGVRLRAVPQSAYEKNGKIEPQLQLLTQGQGAAAAAFELEGMPAAASALGCLIAESGVLSPEEPTNRNAFSIGRVDPQAIVQLDAAAVSALELSGNRARPEASGSLPSSILAWLDRTVTGMGSRLMRQYIHQPLRNVLDIDSRLSTVEVLVQSTIVRDRLRHEVLRNLPDLDRLDRRLQRGLATLKEMYGLKNVIPLIDRVIEILHQYDGRNGKVIIDDYIAPLSDISKKIAPLQILLESTITIEHQAPKINPNFDDDLYTLHEQLNELEQEATRETQRVMKLCEWSEKILKCEPATNGGLLFRVSRKEDKPLREHAKLFRIFSTSKEGVKFSTDKLDAVSEDMRTTTRQYEVRQQALLTMLVDTVASYIPLLDSAKEILGQLDVFAAWALVISESRFPMVRPQVIAANAEATGGLLQLEQVRHPLVELRQASFVPNDVTLSDETGNTWIITGPNMGGKSTLMRSVGIAVVLAHAGCFVPAARAVMSVKDALLCRVGAVDYLSAGLSTFMVEMLESSAILASASPHSLIIIDELGRGTSTFDGFGLAWAIAEDIAVRKRSQCLFASHFHELSGLASLHPQVRNVHVTAESISQDDGRGTGIRFFYKVVPGPATQSHGVNVAKLAGMPPHVVRMAEAKAHELELFQRVHHRHVPNNELAGTTDEIALLSGLTPATRRALMDVAKTVASHDGPVDWTSVASTIADLHLP